MTDFKEMIDTYSTVISFVKAKSVDEKKVSWLMKLLGFEVDDTSNSMIAELITSAAEAKNVNSVLEVFKDQKLVSEVGLIIAQLETGSTTPEKVGKIHLTEHHSLRCPHCERVFGIADSPQVREALETGGNIS